MNNKRMIKSKRNFKIVNFKTIIKEISFDFIVGNFFYLQIKIRILSVFNNSGFNLEID